MKSMTKLMVVAVAALLAAALVVAPAAARTDLNTLESGDTVYVGEENLNFAEEFKAGESGSGLGITKLVHYSDPSAGSIDKTILISPPFELTKTAVGTTTGTYYAFNNDADTADRTAANGTIYVENPRVTIDVMLNKSVTSTGDRKDSVDGKSVTRNEDLIFKLDTNLDGFKGLADAPKIDVEVTLPGGGVTTQFQNAKLGGIDINGSTKFYTDNFTMSGAEAGTYTAVAKWPKATDFYGKGFDSNTVTFEVLTKVIAISSNKDSVVRGNSFTVTITGESQQEYRLFIKEAGIKPYEYPWIVEGQKGLMGDYNYKNMTVETTAGGTRSIQFDTNTSTDDRQFTIRVEEIGVADPDYDEVKVRVEEGDVTITASGTGVYYMGEEITLSGTCTEGDNVYLFLTGPNLKTNGVHLVDLIPTVSGRESTFKKVEVEADDTWSYKWNTADLNETMALDSGGYTVWAVSKPLNKEDLSDANYETAAIHLKTGFLTATSSGATIAKGDDLKNLERRHYREG